MAKYRKTAGDAGARETAGTGLRVTTQRRVILEELHKLHSHPTADALYTIVKRRLPHISLGTVYRNLELLSDHKLIKKLELSGSQRRYDGNVEEHHHVRCIRCGKVGDVFIEDAPLDIKEREMKTGFRILGIRVEFTGICPDCAHNEASHKAKKKGNRR